MHNGQGKKCAYCQKPITPNSYIKVGMDTYFHRECYADECRQINQRPQLQEVTHEK